MEGPWDPMADRKKAKAAKRRRRPATADLDSTPMTTKRGLILAMLDTKSGASIADLTEATGWQAHSIRALFSRVVRKELKLNLISDLVDGQRVYRVTNIEPLPGDGE